jgi:hypothetical protein
MRRLLHSRPVDQALRGASLVVTDRRWAAPLSAAALGFGIFAGVAIGPGAAGTLATGAQQIVEIPSSGGGDGQHGGGGSGVASTEGSVPLGGGGGGGLEASQPPTVPLAPEPIEPLPAPAPAPDPTPKPALEGGEDEEPDGQAFEGTVVHASRAAGSYAIAIEGGELLSVHAPELPEPGTKLSATLRRLANGTFAEAEEAEAEKKLTPQVSFRGVVTFADPDPAAPTYTVSGRGSSLPIEVAPDPAGAPQLPAVGSYVTVTARIEEPETVEASAEPAASPSKAAAVLVQSRVEVEPGPPSAYLDLAGILAERTPDGHLLLSTDWTGEAEPTLTLAVPPGIDAGKLKVGDSYLATVEVGADGSLLLKGIASDEHRRGADDASLAQGDLARQAGP